MSCSDFKPSQYNIELVKGDTWGISFAFKLNDVPINLSSDTIDVAIYKGCSTSAPLWTATNGDGITVTGVDNNVVAISKIVDLAKGDYIWDFKITYTDGIVKTYLWGDFTIYENINQAQ